MSRYSTKRKTAAWYAISTKTGFVVKKTRDPRIKGGRFAFGPYKTKTKACEVGSYQSYGEKPKGCNGAKKRRRR
jgi:hypothetical protein